MILNFSELYGPQMVVVYNGHQKIITFEDRGKWLDWQKWCRVQHVRFPYESTIEFYQGGMMFALVDNPVGMRQMKLEEARHVD